MVLLLHLLALWVEFALMIAAMVLQFQLAEKIQKLHLADVLAGHLPPVLHDSGTAVDILNFNKWCSFLAVAVLRTRSPFSKFLHSTLHLPRDVLVLASPVFPLSIPFPGVFARMPSGLSAAKSSKFFQESITCDRDGLEFLVGRKLFHTPGTSEEDPVEEPADHSHQAVRSSPGQRPS